MRASQKKKKISVSLRHAGVALFAVVCLRPSQHAGFVRVLPHIARHPRSSMRDKWLGNGDERHSSFGASATEFHIAYQT